MPVNMMKFKETLVRKSKVTSTKGFTSPTKPDASAKTSKLGDFLQEDKQTKPEAPKSKEEESVFELGDAHFGAFGDMQEEEAAAADIEEVSLNDEGSENSEFSEQTVDEEEYELYMKTISIHQIHDFEEWRNSEHFPQHLFDSDDEYDEITVDSHEFEQSLCNGGLVVDWTGTRITLDSYADKGVERKKKKEKKKKKTKKIKVKKKSKKSSSGASGSRSVSSTDKKKKRKSEKREKLTKSSSASSQNQLKSPMSPLKDKLTKDASLKLSKLSNDEESRGSSLLENKEPGSKRRSSKERSKSRSSKVSLNGSAENGSNDSLSLLDLNGLSTPITTPDHVRAVRKQPKGTKHTVRRRSSKSPCPPESSDDSMNSSFDIPESMRGSKSEFLVDVSTRSLTTGIADNLKSPKSPKSSHGRNSPAGRRGGRKSSSKMNIWADGVSALNKPELSKSASKGTVEPGGPIRRRSNSRRTSAHSPKRQPSTDSTAAHHRRSSVDNTAAGESSSRRSSTQSPKPRRSSVDVSAVDSSNSRPFISNSASPIARRTSGRRRIPKMGTRRSEVDLNSDQNDDGPRHFGGRRMSNEKKRTNSLNEFEGLAAAKHRLPSLALDDSERAMNIKSRQPEKQKSEKLLNMERMAREGAAQEEFQRSTSVSALEKRKGSHAALKEKLAKAGKSKSNYGEGADAGKPIRSPSLDSTKSNDRRRHDRSEAIRKRSVERPAAMRSASVGATSDIRRAPRGGKRRESQGPRSNSISSQDASKTAFDPFGVAADMQSELKSSSFPDASDRLVASERSQRSTIGLIKKPSVRGSGELKVSNHGKGPVSMMNQKSPRNMGRKKASRRKSGNSLDVSSHHEVQW